MQLRFRALALAAGLALWLGQSPAEALQIGQPAPTFTLPKLDGKGTLSNEHLRDKRAQLVIFWAST